MKKNYQQKIISLANKTLAWHKKENRNPQDVFLSEIYSIIHSLKLNEEDINDDKYSQLIYQLCQLYEVCIESKVRGS